MDLIGLNVFALLLFMALVLLLYAVVRTLLGRSGLPPLLISVLLMFAPFGKSLAEIALDPLQLCLLLVASVLLTPAQSRARVRSCWSPLFSPHCSIRAAPCCCC